MTSGGAPQEWTARRERGTVSAIRLMVWVACRLGRPVARLLLYPICLYFLIFSRSPRKASRQYLARALARPPTLADILRHFHTFGACVLDRVFLLNDRIDLFDLRVHGEEVVLDILRRGDGCVLLGAHFGSFEVARALGRRQPGLQVSLVMYEENARKIRAVLAAINPRLAMEVIGLGRSDSMISVGERLRQGHFVGMLADRSVDGEGQIRYPFLGSPAAFPLGPFRLAALMKRPVVLMVGRLSRRPALRGVLRVVGRSGVGVGAWPGRSGRGNDEPLCRAARALLPRRALQLVQFLRFLGMRCA